MIALHSFTYMATKITFNFQIFDEGKCVYEEIVSIKSAKIILILYNNWVKS